MFRQLTALVFLLAFLAGTFSKTLIIADYYVNTSSYAKDCVNKLRPKMHCNGKCRMMMKLKAEEKKDAENNERKNDLKNEVISSKSFFASAPLLEETITQTTTPSVTNERSTFAMPRSHFHPPAVAAA